MVKRRLNVKLAVGLCIGCVVVLAGTFLLHRFQVRRTADRLLDLATEQEQQGDPVEAATSLRRYLSLRPSDYPSYVKLADIIVTLPEVPGIDSREVSKGYAVLDSVLLKVPKDQPEYDQLRRRAADFTMKVRFYKAAIDHLRYLIDRHPGDVQLNMQYAQALMGSREFEAAGDIVSQLIGFDQQGTQQFQLDPTKVDFDQVVPPRVADARHVRDIARQRWGKGVDQIDAYVRLVAILKYTDAQRNRTVAQRVIDQMVRMNPDNFSAYLKRERFHIGESVMARLRDRDPTRADAEMAMAKQDIAKARELAPDDADVLLASAQLALDEKDYETAKKYLEQGIKKYPQDSRMYRTMAIAISGQGDTEQALKVVAQGLAVLPNDIQLLLLKSDLQLQARDLEGVRKTAAEMSQAGIRKELVAYLEARLAVAEGDYGVAVKKLTDVRPLLSAFPGQVRRVDLMLASSYERQGKYDLAKAAYQRVVDSSRGADTSDPNLLAAQTGLLRLQRRSERQSPATPPGAGPTASDAAGTASTFKAELQQAMQDLAAAKPDASAGEKKLVEASLLAKHAQYTQAQAAYAQARQLAAANTDQTVKDSVIAKAWSGAILAAIRDPQQGLDPALKMLQQAQAELDGKDVFRMTEENVILAYAGVVMNDPDRGGPAEAAKLVGGAQQKFGDTTLNRIAKMRLISALGGDQVKSRLKKLEEGMADRSTTDRLLFWSNIWLHYYKAGLRDDARRCLKDLAKLQPNNLRITTMLFDLAYESKDDQGMQEAIANLKKLSDATEWKCCEASRLLFLAMTGQKDKSVLSDGMRLCDEAIRARPDWNKPYRIKGDLQMAQGDYTAAVTSYEKAFQLGPPQPAAVRKYSLALSRLGRPEEAQKALDMLSQEQRGSVLPEQQVANLLRLGKKAEALTLAKEVVDRSPDDPRTHVWYGQVLANAKDTKAAEGEFRRAIELSPQFSRAWLALIVTMVINGEKDQAEAELRKAQLHLIQDELPAVMAKSCEVLGRPGEAEEYYRMASDANPNSLAALRQLATFYLGKNYRQRDKFTKAGTYLRQMLKLGATPATASDSNVRWARQQMAQLLARTHRYQNTLKAIELLNENRVNGALSNADQLNMATLLAAQPEPILQQQAIEKLAKLDKENALGTTQRLLLARLYNRADNWPACEQVMSNLLAQDESNPTILAVYCEMLIARDDLGQATRQIRRLTTLVAGIDASNQLKPVLERTVRELQARLLVKQGKRPEALALLKKNLPASPAAKDVPQLRHLADLLLQLKFYPQAEQAYRKMVQLDPKQTLRLASFLGRHGNLDQAFEILDRAKTTAAGLMALQVAVDSVNRRRDEVGDRYDDRIETWLNDLARSHPEAYQVQIERARFREGQGKYAEVTQIYRDLLKQPALAAGPQRAAVLNNLAYLLALEGKDGKETLGMINDAIKVIGPSAELLDTRGIVKLANGDVQGAIEDLQLSLLGGRTTLKLLHLALAQQAAGDKAAARKTLQEAQRAGLDKKQTRGLERQKYEKLLRDLGVAEAHRSRGAQIAA